MNWILDPTNRMIIFMIAVAVGSIWWLIHGLLNFSKGPNVTKPKKLENRRPIKVVSNDKIILIRDVTSSELEKALTDFWNIYIKEVPDLALQMTTISDHDFAVTFPTDITFEVFSYLVNYLVFPDNIMWGSVVTGWATTLPKDKWAIEKIVNQKVMLFIPEGNKDGESVYLSTSEGLSARISFDYNGFDDLPKGSSYEDIYQIKILKKPIKKYIAPTIDVSLLKNNQKKYFS